MTTDAQLPKDGERGPRAPLAPVLGRASSAASLRGPRLVALLLVVAIGAGLGGRLAGEPPPPVRAQPSPSTAVSSPAVMDLRAPRDVVTESALPVSGTIAAPGVEHVRILLVRGFSTVASIEVTPVAGGFRGSIPLPKARVEGRLVILALAEDRSGRLVGATREAVSIGPRPVVRIGPRPGRPTGDDGIMGGRAFPTSR